jgi:serine acetyltransferase
MALSFQNIRSNPAGDRPVIAATAGLHPSAVVIGNVEIGEKVYVGPNAVIRLAPASSGLAEFALKVCRTNLFLTEVSSLIRSASKSNRMENNYVRPNTSDRQNR